MQLPNVSKRSAGTTGTLHVLTAPVTYPLFFLGAKTLSPAI